MGPQDYPTHNLNFPKSCYPENSKNVFKEGCLGFLEAFCEQLRALNWTQMVIEVSAFI